MLNALILNAGLFYLTDVGRCVIISLRIFRLLLECMATCWLVNQVKLLLLKHLSAPKEWPIPIIPAGVKQEDLQEF